MNIFYLHESPAEAARMHNDKHCVKMILESAQMLCTAHRMLDGIEYVTKSKTGKNVKRWSHPNSNIDSVLYNASHKNHPSTVWARSSKQNYLWLYNLFLELCEEYKYRYGKTHLSYTKLHKVLANPPRNISDTPFTQPPQAMPDEYKHESSVHAYRQYYIGAKSHLATWSVRPRPVWYKQDLQGTSDAVI